jgi:hypothetical protein
MTPLVWLLLATAPAVIVAQGADHAADSWIAGHDTELKALNQSIWSHPELGLQEHHASSELIRLLEQAGFAVERGVAGMPTAFVATAGSGKPVIGILAEYDALPGMSQATVPRRESRADAPEALRPISVTPAATRSTAPPALARRPPPGTRPRRPVFPAPSGSTAHPPRRPVSARSR